MPSYSLDMLLMTKLNLEMLSLGSPLMSNVLVLLAFGENSHMISFTALVEALQGQERWVSAESEHPMDANKQKAMITTLQKHRVEHRTT